MQPRDMSDPLRRDETRAALLAPKVGDRFHEMYSWWMYVVEVTDHHVVTLAANAPCTFPDDGRAKRWTRTEFVTGNCYRGMPDVPVVMLAERDNRVTGWLDSCAGWLSSTA